MAMLDEVSPGAWPALDRRLVAQRLKDLEKLDGNFLNPIARR